jgi:hypothetical protein
LTASPDAYPQKLDLIRDAVLLVRLNAAGFVRGFLDDWTLARLRRARGCPPSWSPMRRGVAAAPPRTFHFFTRGMSALRW